MGLIKRKVYGFAILYYAIGLSIFSNLITTNVSVYNDRFLYNAVFGMCLLVAYGLYQLMRPNEDGKFISNIGTFAKKNVLPLALLGVLLGASIFKIESHLIYLPHLTYLPHLIYLYHLILKVYVCAYFLHLFL